MAQGPICIITPSGMVCASSPLKAHSGTGTCNPHTPPAGQSAKAKKIKDKLGEVLGEFSQDEQDLIGTVVELMLAVPVKASEHFTIVYNK